MDTIVALSSGRPPAAIAVIRTSGPRAHAAALELAGALPPARYASLRTLRHPKSGIELDHAVVLRFDGPATATGEDIVEYQCHGGRAVVAAVLEALTSIDGVRLAAPGEFTRRALASGRIDLTEAEGFADLLEAETEQQRRNALALAGGVLSSQVDRWRAQLVSLSARAEAAIDYVGDDDETAIDTAMLTQEARSLAAQLDHWLAQPRAEPLKDGIRVTVAGPPNSGKSSLVNALACSERAIVTPIAGTTRDTIEVPLSFGGIPILLVDTAGLRETSDPIETMGVVRTRHEMDRAEILVWLGLPGDVPQHGCAITVRSKADLSAAGPQHAVDAVVSARTGKGVGALAQLIVERTKTLLPSETFLALNKRQAYLLGEAALSMRALSEDILLIAEAFRSARAALDRLTGRAGVDDVLDALFARYCLGK